MIKEITNSSSTIKMLPATKDDPRKRKPDITVAGRELGWKPQVPKMAVCGEFVLTRLCTWDYRASTSSRMMIAEEGYMLTF